MLRNPSFFKLAGGPSWLIMTLDSKPVADLDEFIRVIQGLKDGSRVPITYSSLKDRHKVLKTVNTSLINPGYPCRL
jgi:hypothetical protein